MNKKLCVYLLIAGVVFSPAAQAQIAGASTAIDPGKPVTSIQQPPAPAEPQTPPDGNNE
jgi:hypothetical protein